MTAESLGYDHQEFETVAEAEVDSRGRVSLGRAGAEPGRRYRVERNVDGVLEAGRECLEIYPTLHLINVALNGFGWGIVLARVPPEVR